LRKTALETQIYHAIPKFEDHLEYELGEFTQINSFLYSSKQGGACFFYQNKWLSPFILEFDSIGEAARGLREIQRNWALAPGAFYRRASLIVEKLPPINTKPKEFPFLVPASPMGAFSLLDERRLLASAETESPFPRGEPAMHEDKLSPPSRAYLKLQEALLRLRKWPEPGERVFDAGASPGGWTWVSAKLGAKVTACDRAPLDAAIAGMRGVDYLKHDAFTLKPADIGALNWLFCDAAVYPERLYEWVCKWLDSGLCGNFVCTIKLQGKPGSEEFSHAYALIKKFNVIPNSKVVHLYNNKHELTWIKTSLQ
jgi:23S rRNA (cytidine2498-2'-O)-methyltransferase